ncbi:MAG TPA: hypothetical protein VIW64_12875 [Pyrinomonadaceae bacterium]
MFNSTVLDVAVGLVFVYLLLAILCTAANEWLAALTKTRAKFLEKGVKELLNNQALTPDGDQQEFVMAFYQHPLITGMMRDGKHPTYLSARIFAAAVGDLLTKVSFASPPSSPPLDDDFSVTGTIELERAVNSIPEGDVQKALSGLVKLGKREKTTTQETLEAWFNDSMDRVSGWYKRRTQTWTLIVAILITLFANANTISIARRLWTDPVLRSAVVEEAKVRAQKPPPAITVDYPNPDDPDAPQVKNNENEGKVLSETEQKMLGELLGWRDNETPFTDAAGNYITKRELFERLIGWLLTVFALSLGAPFWFDLLNKFINIRSAGKSPDEKAKKPEKEESPARA